MGRPKPHPVDAPRGPFNDAFAGLASLKSALAEPEADLPAESVPETGTETDPGAAEDALSRGAELGPKVVVRRERKGHGGKTVTRISGLEVGPEGARDLAKDLAARLGAGAKVEGAEIWIQGDQTRRLQDILTQMGAKRVVLGTE